MIYYCNVFIIFYFHQWISSWEDCTRNVFSSSKDILRGQEELWHFSKVLLEFNVNSCESLFIKPEAFLQHIQFQSLVRWRSAWLPLLVSLTGEISFVETLFFFCKKQLIVHTSNQVRHTFVSDSITHRLLEVVSFNFMLLFRQISEGLTYASKCIHVLNVCILGLMLGQITYSARDQQTILFQILHQFSGP